jgi:hypothetical protein
VLLDEYDPKLLSQAKLKGEAFREKDLKGHMANTDGEKSGDSSVKEFKKEELDAMVRESKDKKKGSDRSSSKEKDREEDDMIPQRMNPKEDYQVKQALTSLKSYEVFKKIGSPPGLAEQAVGQKIEASKE